MGGTVRHASRRGHCAVFSGPAPHDRVDSGGRMPLEGRQLAAPVDLRDLLRVGLDAEPDAIAMSSATDRITWRELEDATDRLARNYVALGLTAGGPSGAVAPRRVP